VKPSMGEIAKAVGVKWAQLDDDGKQVRAASGGGVFCARLATGHLLPFRLLRLLLLLLLLLTPHLRALSHLLNTKALPKTIFFFLNNEKNPPPLLLLACISCRCTRRRRRRTTRRRSARTRSGWRRRAAKRCERTRATSPFSDLHFLFEMFAPSERRAPWHPSCAPRDEMLLLFLHSPPSSANARYPPILRTRCVSGATPSPPTYASRLRSETPRTPRPAPRLSSPVVSFPLTPHPILDVNNPRKTNRAATAATATTATGRTCPCPWWGDAYKLNPALTHGLKAPGLKAPAFKPFSL
jgi:hypothetical protein